MQTGAGIVAKRGHDFSVTTFQFRRLISRERLLSRSGYPVAASASQSERRLLSRGVIGGFYVGDSADDESLARFAGVPFHHVKEFFERMHKS